MKGLQMKFLSYSALIFSAFLLVSCSKKEEKQTEQHEATTPASSQQPASHEHAPGESDSHEGTDMDAKMHDMTDMMVKHLGPADKNYEHRFIDMMIPHHEGAIKMAEDALKKSNRPELKKMAQEVIDAQKKEIETMKEWRKQWYSH